MVEPAVVEAVITELRGDAGGGPGQRGAAADFFDRAGSAARRLLRAGPVTASRDSAWLIRPTVNGPASSAAFNGQSAMRWPGIRAHHHDHQRRREPAQPARDRRRRVQRRDERRPLSLSPGALTRGEQLLELARRPDHARRRTGWLARSRARHRARRRPVPPARPASAPHPAPPTAYGTPTRVRARHLGQLRRRSRRGLPVGRITRRGHRSDPGPSAPAATCGTNPARSSEVLRRPRLPGHRRIPVPSGRSASRPASWAASSCARETAGVPVPRMARAPDRGPPATPGPCRPSGAAASRAWPPAPARPGRGRGRPPRTQRAPARPGPAPRPAARRCPCGRWGGCPAPGH